MPLPEYRNLSNDELVFADHYAETGNWGALRQLRELSAQRENSTTDQEEEDE